MNSEIWVAILAAAVSVFSVIWNARNARRVTVLEAQLAQTRRQEDRLETARELLDRYREPLRAAADDLRDRIDNVRRRRFLAVYLRNSDEHRRRIALLSTLYRVGKYWAVAENFFSGLNTLRPETREEAARVTSLLRKIASAFGSDRAELGGTYLMVWREEQRSIGELMQHSDGIHSIGFAGFVARYEGDLSGWFSQLTADLVVDDVAHSPRLSHLEGLLDDLVAELDGTGKAPG